MVMQFLDLRKRPPLCSGWQHPRRHSDERTLRGRISYSIERGNRPLSNRHEVSSWAKRRISAVPQRQKHNNRSVWRAYSARKNILFNRKGEHTPFELTPGKT